MADGFGDRAIGTQMAGRYGWDALKKRAIDGIGESASPVAAFITGAEFSCVKSIVEAA